MTQQRKRFLSCILILLAFSGFSLEAQARKVDIWDFGGVETQGDLYVNNITRGMLNGLEQVTAGKFAGGTLVFGDLSLNALANDRLYYFNDDGSPGAKGAGTQSYCKNDFGDGYVANGLYYCNGTGGENRRFIVVDKVLAGDKITFYGRMNNAASDNVNFVHIDDSGAQDGKQAEAALMNATATKYEYVAQFDGKYKIYTTATAGKPVYYRVVRTPGIAVSGTINSSGAKLESGFGVKFVNGATKRETAATVKDDGNFSIGLAAGFEYTAVLTGVLGTGFSKESQVLSVSNDSLAKGTLEGVMLSVEVKKTYLASGGLKGFEAGYDASNFGLVLNPPSGSLFLPVKASIDLASLSYSAKLEPDVAYLAAISGVNDYQVAEGGILNNNRDAVQDLVLGKKPTYAVSGSFLGLPEGTLVKALVFSNVDDRYEYSGRLSLGGYSASLRDGAYEIKAEIEGWSTSTHVVVGGKDAGKDIKMRRTDSMPLVLVRMSDLFVGYAGKNPNYATVKEAVEAAKAMNPRNEDERITIHIAPGVYRAQVIIATPYLSFVNDEPGKEVKLTWYYGIGYKYYSANAAGYYDEDSAYDKYDKHIAARWGAATLVRPEAKFFRAKSITFETSFSKYITDEEIEDGVVSDGSVAFVRKLNADVASRAAIERSCALAVEGDNSEFLDCVFLGSQDTLFTGTNVRLYFKNCFIEGNTDYVFGDGECVFDSCELHWCGYRETASGGYIAVNKDTAAYGYLFRDCFVSANKETKQAPGYFGRPWSPGAKVLFLDTKLESLSMIAPVGWYEMSGNKPENAKYREFGTTCAGAPVEVSARTKGTISAERPAVNVKDYFGSWVPSFYDEKSLGKPVSKAYREKDPGAEGNKTTIFLAGDSTVKDYSAKGMYNGGLARDEGSWGEYLQSYLDEDVLVANFANGGRSSRSFINEGNLDRIAAQIKPGDYLFIQFGHNDCSNSQGYLVERYVPLGEPDSNGSYPVAAGKRVATPAAFTAAYGSAFFSYDCGGTYKWYLLQYIEAARKAGAVPVLITPVSRQYFASDGTIRPHHDAADATTGTQVTSGNAYVAAVKQLAKERNVLLIDAFEITKAMYEAAYKADKSAKATSPLAIQTMFTGDSTHGNKLGGFLTAGYLAKAIRGMGLDISDDFSKPARVLGENFDGQAVFEVKANHELFAYSRNESGKYSEVSFYWTWIGQGLIDGIE